MTNREQVAWSLLFEEYSDKTVAHIIAEMLDQIGVYLDRTERDNLEDWFGLNCDPVTNNWGTFED